MRAVFYEEHGDTSVIQVGELPVPEVGPRDVLVRVNAASLNGFDPMILEGGTTLKNPWPMIPLGDLAGEIVEIGSDVGTYSIDPNVVFMNPFVKHPWKVGDRVCPYPPVMSEGMTGETRQGAACEYIRFPVEQMIPTPDEVSDVHAAALPIAYGTAYRLLHTKAKVRKGEQVLILGATGGVGIACIQLAKLIGAEVIACSRSQEKLERCKDHGADHIINTKEQDLEEECARIAGKPRLFSRKGIDVAVNFIGGETWGPSVRTLRQEGRILTCGATAGYDPKEDLRYIWSRELEIIGSNGWYPSDQLELLRLVATGELEPVIDSIRTLEETPQAIQALIDGNVFGKAIVQP